MMILQRPPEFEGRARRAHLHLAFNVGVLTLFSLLWLPFHADRMFNGLDGQMLRMFVRQYWTMAPFNLDLPMNILVGLGNSFYPIRMTLVPAYLVQLPLFGDVIPVVSYTIFAVELFVASWLWARIAGFRQAIGLASGWVLCLLALPFLNRPYLNAILQIVPQISDLLFFSAVFIRCLQLLGAGNGRRNLAFGLLVVLIPSYLLAANPLFVLVIVPTTALTAAWVVLSSIDRRSFLMRFWAVCLALALLAASGLPLFLYGNTAYAAFSHFSAEFGNIQGTLFHATILLQGPTYPIGMVLVPLALAGVFAAAWSGAGDIRRFAYFALALIALHILLGLAAILILSGWRGPQGGYFEIGIWPLYTAYAVHAVDLAWTQCRRHVRSKWLADGAVAAEAGGIVRSLEPLRGALVRTADRLPAIVRSPWIFLIPLGVLLALGLTKGGKAVPSHYPPRSPPLVEVLRAEAALREDGAFRGYAATFTGTAGRPGPISWLDQHALDQVVLVPGIGNDHRFVGLWYFRIPTLNEYSQYVTAPLYLLASRLLTREGDVEVRNVLLLTRPDLKLLRMLGVRFIITDIALDGASQRMEQTVPNGPTLRLYELSEANLATFSPTVVRRFDDATEILQAMQGGPDFTREAFLSDPVEGPLKVAQASRMTVGIEGIRLRASSNGVSMIIVPVQFSRCLEATFSTPRPARFSMHRANLAVTAVVFSGQLDVTLQLKNGPFRHSLCRYRDAQDMHALRIRDVPRQLNRQAYR